LLDQLLEPLTVFGPIDLYRLRGREVVAYLSYLLEQDRDFASKAKALDSEQQEATQRQRYQRTLESLDGRYDGWQVVSATGKTIGTFICRDGGSPWVEQMREGRLATLPVNLAFAERFAEGEVRLRN
jgi:hypothetical protein